MGRPTKEYDIKAFQDLVGLGCSQEEICWYFRDETGKPANVDTLTRWCKRQFGMTFQEYFRQNGFMALKIKLRRNQFKLSEKSASMAIWLGKQYLGQKEVQDVQLVATTDETIRKMDEYFKRTGFKSDKVQSD
jgi:hypothetical protein